MSEETWKSKMYDTPKVRKIRRALKLVLWPLFILSTAYALKMFWGASNNSVTQYLYWAPSALFLVALCCAHKLELPDRQTSVRSYEFNKCARNDYFAFNTILRKAEAGDAVACFDVGFCLLTDDIKCVKQDAVEAEKWLIKAAELGDGDAYFRLGDLYEEQMEFEKAAEFFRRGEKISFKCKLRLARLFERGLGVPMNETFAKTLRAEAEYQSRDVHGLAVKFSTLKGTRVFDVSKTVDKTELWGIAEDF